MNNYLSTKTERDLKCSGLTQNQINQIALRFYGRIGFLDYFADASTILGYFEPTFTFEKTERRISNIRHVKRFQTSSQKNRIKIQINSRKHLIVRGCGHITRLEKCRFQRLQSVAECWKLSSDFNILLYGPFFSNSHMINAIPIIAKVDRSSYKHLEIRHPLNAGVSRYFHVLPWLVKSALHCYSSEARNNKTNKILIFIVFELFKGL
jgi:hypothetical protein